MNNTAGTYSLGKKIFGFFAVGLVFSGCVAFGYFWRDIRQGRTSNMANSLLGIRTPGANDDGPLVFKKVHGRIVSSYRKPVVAQDLLFSGMEGLVASLGDPHTNFFTPKVATSFLDETRGRFFGIGARLFADPLGVKVTSVFADSPAMVAGVKPDDLIVAVDGVNVGGKESEDIVLLIKGAEGTTVKLKIIRTGASSPISFEIKRAKVVPPTVETKFLPEQKIGLIKITMFTQETPDQLVAEWNALETNGKLNGLIIDLRGNGGGVLESATEMASLFLDNKELVRLSYKSGMEEISNTYGGKVKKIGYKVVVLIDDDSASASEILAGALHDYGKVQLVGTHSYGKFSVQTVFTRRDGAGVKLTIAHYYLPKSGALARKVDDEGHYVSGGLQPDVKVELDDETPFEWGVPAKDAQVAAAIKLLQTP